MDGRNAGGGGDSSAPAGDGTCRIVSASTFAAGFGNGSEEGPLLGCAGGGNDFGNAGSGGDTAGSGLCGAISHSFNGSNARRSGVERGSSF
jgi:hypothetical protein